MTSKGLAPVDRPNDPNDLIREDYQEKARRLFKLALGKKSKSTIESYEYALRDFCKFMEMTDPRESLGYLLSLGRLEAELRVMEYLGWMEEKELAPSTQRLRLSALKFYVKTANRAQWIDWTLEVEGPPQENVKEVEGPTPEEFARILAVVDELEGPTGERNRLMVYMLAFMALRISSVLSIDMEHVDLKKGTVSVTWKGKRKKRLVRTVPAITLDMLASWIKTRGSHPGPVFCNYDLRPEVAGLRLSRSTAYKIVRRIGKKAEMDKLHPHAFRHFSTTEGLEATDGNTRKVMKHTGHTSERMIGIYEDRRKDEAGELAQMIEDRWMNDEEEE
jgi:integrase/recombinase XerC